MPTNPIFGIQPDPPGSIAGISPINECDTPHSVIPDPLPMMLTSLSKQMPPDPLPFLPISSDIIPTNWMNQIHFYSIFAIRYSTPWFEHRFPSYWHFIFLFSDANGAITSFFDCFVSLLGFAHLVGLFGTSSVSGNESCPFISDCSITMAHIYICMV